MLPSDTSAPLDDVEFLARSDHRVTALVALADRPRSRRALKALTEGSNSTVRRTLREFEARQWITRTDGHYEATALGVFVAEGMRELIERVATERRLRTVWEWLPPEESGFTVEMGREAVVTDATVDNPYGPVNRFETLLRGTDRFRFVGHEVALLEPCRDALAAGIVDGMDTDIVDPPDAADYVLARYGDHCSGPLESGNLRVWVHDGLPGYGVALFDDRVAVSGHDPTNGTVQVLLDTAAVEAYEWAESTFESYRTEARPLASGLPTG
ncbi:helix-turn-helix transcriptional regulator [Halomarina rubra]|uniref:Helix-turn-helix transcriptional regulator n=1 Tax=Halomarina rubra TaxID=2071873 RepID=A0ABD6AZQ9_9EURY|nr:MarR family transcriptional regulator [Halomarina rubra]